MRQDPPEGRTRPRSIRKVVVFPAPFGPMSPNTVPFGTENVSWSIATLVRAPRPYTFLRSSTAIASDLSASSYSVPDSLRFVNFWISLKVSFLA